MSERKPIASDLGKVLAGDVGGQIVGLVRGIAVPLMVTPARYGLWRILLLVWQYGVFLHLGSFALLNREIPGLLAVGENERASRMQQVAFWGAMAVSSLVALGLIAFSLTSAAGIDPMQRWALRISALGLVAEQILIYILVDFRVRSQFGLLSLAGFAKAVAALLFMIPLALVAGVPGLAAGMVLATTLAAVGFGRRVRFAPPRFDLRAFCGQALRGIPLSGLPFLNTMISSVGQIVTAVFLGLQATGFYGLGVMIGTVVYAAPRALGTVLYPSYLASYAMVEDTTQTGQNIRRSIQITAVVSTLAVCGAAILIAPVYRHVFPQYLPAIGPTYALLAMMPFLANALVLQNALLALRLHSRAIAVQLATIVCSAGLSMAGAIIHHDVTWVALGVMVANLGYGIAVMWLALAATRTVGRSPLREIYEALSPVVVVGGMTIALIMLWVPSDDGISQIGVPAGQLLVLSPAAVFYGMRSWRMLRATEA